MNGSAPARGRRIGWRVIVFVLCAAAALPVRAGDIEVRDAWIRWLPANLPGAGYMTIINTGSADRMLVGVTSPSYGDVSLHRSHVDQGMNEMTPVASIDLKPHATVRFAAGGYHLMMMQPTRPLHPGERVMVTLRFASGASVTVPFEVRAEPR